MNQVKHLGGCQRTASFDYSCDNEARDLQMYCLTPTCQHQAVHKPAAAFSKNLNLSLGHLPGQRFPSREGSPGNSRQEVCSLLPTRVKATGTGMSPRGAVESEQGWRWGALPVGPSPPLPAPGTQECVLWKSVCPEKLGPGQGTLRPSQTGNMILPAQPSTGRKLCSLQLRLCGSPTPGGHQPT